MKPILFLLLMLSAQMCFGKTGLNDTTYLNKSGGHFSNGTKDHYRFFRVLHIDSVTMAPQKVIKEEIYYKSGRLLGDGYRVPGNTRKNTGLSRNYDRKGRLKKYYLFNYKDNLKYFSSLLENMKCVSACNIEGSNLAATFFPDGHIKNIGFYPSGNGNFVMDKSKRICEWVVCDAGRKHRVHRREYGEGK